MEFAADLAGGIGRIDVDGWRGAGEGDLGITSGMVKAEATLERLLGFVTPAVVAESVPVRVSTPAPPWVNAVPAVVVELVP